MNNYVITEWGDSGGAASSEGGFFRSHGAMNYGLYFNSGVNGNVVDSLNPARVDLFVGGDAGLNWGLRLGYESKEVQAAGKMLLGLIWVFLQQFLVPICG